MVYSGKKPKIVGTFIRERRESLGISQRALGQLFTPPVTTQFISNVERGVTPLPPSHVSVLARALSIQEKEMMNLLEQEYTLKLSERLGKSEPNGTAGPQPCLNGQPPVQPPLHVSATDYDFMKKLYQAYKQADGKTKQAFTTVCESILNLPKNG